MYTTQLEQLKQNQMERANNYQSKRNNLNKPRFALVKGKIIDRMQSFNSSITALSLIKVANSLDGLLAKRNNQIKELQAENDKLQAELEALREAQLSSLPAIDYKIYMGKKTITAYELSDNVVLHKSRLSDKWYIERHMRIKDVFFNGDDWTSKPYLFDSAVDGLQAWLQGGK